MNFIKRIMKYYRLIYSYEDELNRFIESDLEYILLFLSENNMEDTPINRKKVANDTVLRRYAFYQEGVIYTEDETLNGNAIRVSDITGMYPEDWEEVSMMFKLSHKAQINKHCKDGKDRSYLTYFLNDVKIFQQKLPFDENYEEGFNRRTHISDEYILNGKMYQTRYNMETEKTRHVSFPLSKIKLKELGVPNNFKIVSNSNFF